MFLKKKRLYETEADIIEGCKSNEREAQQKLYSLYASRFFGISLRYMKDERDAEEVLTNAFMKIFDNISNYRSEGSFEGWMKRILINEALGYIRKNRNMYVEVELKHNESNEDFAWEDTQLETQELLKMIQSLPSGYRTVFKVKRSGGKEQQAIRRVKAQGERLTQRARKARPFGRVE
jgi:RNA polymerase sigma-70 factor (ECF subfamily)